MKRTPIEFGTPVEVVLSMRQRDLILDETFADADLTDRLTIATLKGQGITVKYTLDDLEALIGYVAAEANHCTKKKLQRELDDLFVQLQTTLESFDDGEWQDPGNEG